MAGGGSGPRRIEAVIPSARPCAVGMGPFDKLQRCNVDDKATVRPADDHEPRVYRGLRTLKGFPDEGAVPGERQDGQT